MQAGTPSQMQQFHIPSRGLTDSRPCGYGWLRWAVLAAGGLVIAVLAVLAFIAMAGGTNVLNSGLSPSPAPCSPKPCLDVRGYSLSVSNVSESDGIVRMQVTYRNSSDATHASPEDLQLVDGKHQTSNSIQDPLGCTHWSRTEFNNGAKFGPITVCFRPTSLDAPLVLHWTPDLGLICCQADVRIK